MPTESDKWTEVVAKLKARTQDGTLKWTARAPNKERERDVGPNFFADFKGRSLRLHKVLVTHHYAVTSGGFGTKNIFRFTPGVETKEEEEVRLEIVDDTDNLLWTFPKTAATKDLYTAVCYQAAGVRDFLNSILDDDDDDGPPSSDTTIPRST